MSNSNTIVTAKETHIGMVLFDPRYIYIWAIVVNCLKVAALERGIHLTVMPVRSIAEQVDALHKLLASGVDGLIIKPIESEHPDLIKLVQVSSAAGVPVISIDAAIPESSLVATIGPDNAKAQATVAHHIFGCLGGKGRVGFFKGDQRSEAGRARRLGFEQALQSSPDVELVYEAELDWSLAAARRVVGSTMAQKMLATGVRVDAIICSTDDAALGVSDILIKAGLAEKVLVAGFDGIPDALLAMVAGNLAATIRQSPTALSCSILDTLLAALEGEPVSGVICNDMELVTPYNVCRASISSLQLIPGMINMLLDSDETHRKLHAISSAVSSIRDLKLMMQNVVDALRENFDLHTASLYLLGAATDKVAPTLELQAISGAAAEDAAAYNETLITLCVEHKRLLVSHFSLVETHIDQINSKAVFPLIIADEVVGILNINSVKPRAFDDDKVIVLHGIVDQISVALENARLYAQTVEAYRALHENQEKLLTSEKMASLGRLTAGIAHEMNTPLAAVRSAMSELRNLINEYRDALDDPEVNVDDHREIAAEMTQSLRLAQASAERAAGFVHGIKSQTRDLNAQQLIWFNPVPVLEEAILLLSHALRAKNCRVNFMADANCPKIYGSPPRLVQIITNLITNAIDASASAGGGPIDVGLTCQEATIALHVSDHGCGIPAELIGNVFDPMFSTKPFGQGTGLGLTIVHDIVTSEFNGSITIDSEVGIGTSFTIYLAVLPQP